MTSDEVFSAIGKSTSEESYTIVYLINNDKMDDAVKMILHRYDCTKEAAQEVTRMFKAKLNRVKRPD